MFPFVLFAGIILQAVTFLFPLYSFFAKMKKRGELGTEILFPTF
jgi:zinc transporter ZupT